MAAGVAAVPAAAAAAAAARLAEPAAALPPAAAPFARWPVQAPSPPPAQHQAPRERPCQSRRRLGARAARVWVGRPPGRLQARGASTGSKRSNRRADSVRRTGQHTRSSSAPAAPSPSGSGSNCTRTSPPAGPAAVGGSTPTTRPIHQQSCRNVCAGLGGAAAARSRVSSPQQRWKARQRRTRPAQKLQQPAPAGSLPSAPPRIGRTQRWWPGRAAWPGQALAARAAAPSHRRCRRQQARHAAAAPTRTCCQLRGRAEEGRGWCRQ